MRIGFSLIASETTFLIHKEFKDNVCMMEFKVMKSYLLEQGPIPLFALTEGKQRYL
jgi:hypothetical protein